MKQPKRDFREVTEEVTAKIEGEDLVFYHQKKEIGLMNLESKEMRIMPDYHMENHQIWAKVRDENLSDHYAENCGDGWC